MPYLNEKEREKLLEELIKMDFVQAKRKLRLMDRDIRLRVYRNVQNVNQWVTRYQLPGKGTTVTLIESYNNPEEDPSQRVAADFELSEVIVEPIPENRT